MIIIIIIIERKKERKKKKKKEKTKRDKEEGIEEKDVNRNIRKAEIRNDGDDKIASSA